MSDPNITLMVQTIQKATERAVVASVVSDRERVLTKLRALLDNPDGTPAEQIMLRAADLLGKSAGLYKDVVETVVHRTTEEIESELDELLAKHGLSLESLDDSVH